MISVIIPAIKIDTAFHRLRNQLLKESGEVEVIIVVDKNTFNELERLEGEKIAVSPGKGRGLAIVKGIKKAKGSILLIVHADTTLPEKWYSLIKRTLSDSRNAGGGFSLSFNRSNCILQSLILLSDLFFLVTRELWGDRCMFCRSEVVKNHLDKLDIPIMEDVVLSRLIRRKGRIIKLKEKVITSSHTFFRKGIFIHTFHILLCRVMYFLGINPNSIYEIYYQSKD